MSDLTYTKTFTVITCSNVGCGVNFALDDEFIAARRKDRQSFYCPNGHSRWYPGKTEEQKLREQLEEEQRRVVRLRASEERARAEADHQRSVANGYKGAATKMKKRIGKGVCPCCNRHFTNVERHMATQHPEDAGDA